MSNEKNPDVSNPLENVAGREDGTVGGAAQGEGVKGPLELLAEEAVKVGASAAVVECGDVIATVGAGQSFDFLSSCKHLSHLDFAMLIDVTVVDWFDSRETRFEVVYQLLSLSKKHRMTVKVPVSEDRPEVASVVGLWSGANFLEREAWDMFGIVFKGHPDLRRILMYEEFKGHPLRKDYPLQGKQPRVPLRMPEVENTARRMHRGDLVQIRKKGGGESSVVSQQSR